MPATQKHISQKNRVDTSADIKAILLLPLYGNSTTAALANPIAPAVEIMNTIRK
jgi:hypothetical protein